MADDIIKGMHGCSREDSYVVPEDPAVREKLEWFRDQKLALLGGNLYDPVRRGNADGAFSG